MFRRVGLSLIFLVVAIGCAFAIEQSWVVGPQGGPTWLFFFDTDSDKIESPMTWAYGAQITRVFDFAWTHDFGLQLDYLHSAGEAWKVKPRDDPFERDRVKFSYSYHLACFSVTYFMGGKFFDPFFSGGFGATFLKVDQTKRLATDETDFTVNLSGGIDFRLLKWLSIGLQERYLYATAGKAFDVATSALVTNLRLVILF